MLKRLMLWIRMVEMMNLIGIKHFQLLIGNQMTEETKLGILESNWNLTNTFPESLSTQTTALFMYQLMYTMEIQRLSTPSNGQKCWTTSSKIITNETHLFHGNILE